MPVVFDRLRKHGTLDTAVKGPSMQKKRPQTSPVAKKKNTPHKPAVKETQSQKTATMSTAQKTRIQQKKQPKRQPLKSKPQIKQPEKKALSEKKEIPSQEKEEVMVPTQEADVKNYSPWTITEPVPEATPLRLQPDEPIILGRDNKELYEAYIAIQEQISVQWQPPFGENLAAVACISVDHEGKTKAVILQEKSGSLIFDKSVMRACKELVWPPFCYQKDILITFRQ